MCRDIKKIWRGLKKILKKKERDKRKIERIVKKIREKVNEIEKKIKKKLRKGIGNEDGELDKKGIKIDSKIERLEIVDKKEGKKERMKVKWSGKEENERKKKNEILLMNWNLKLIEKRNKREEEDRRVDVLRKELIVLKEINRYRNRNIY